MSGEKGERGRKGEREGGGGETSFPWLVAEPPLRTAAAPRERTGARPRKTRPGCSPRRALGGPGQGRSRASLLAYKELSATLVLIPTRAPTEVDSLCAPSSAPGMLD